MAKIERPIFFDADAVIQLLTWNCWGRVCRTLGDKACLSRYVADEEVRGYRDRTTRRWRRFNSSALSANSVPRALEAGDLAEEQYERYLRYFSELAVADPGERETFAMAWALGYDVCSRDVAARDVFFSYRPEGCCSRHIDVMPLLRRLRII